MFKEFYGNIYDVNLHDTYSLQNLIFNLVVFLHRKKLCILTLELLLQTKSFHLFVTIIHGVLLGFWFSATNGKYFWFAAGKKSANGKSYSQFKIEFEAELRLKIWIWDKFEEIFWRKFEIRAQNPNLGSNLKKFKKIQVKTRVIYDRVRNRKNYFEIPAFLPIERGISRAGKFKVMLVVTRSNWGLFLFWFEFPALEVPRSKFKKAAISK